jgi:hypothetical protein
MVTAASLNKGQEILIFHHAREHSWKFNLIIFFTLKKKG